MQKISSKLTHVIKISNRLYLLLEMKISFKLLHEEDLMRFLSALAKQGAGVFSVTECMMERMETGGSIRFQPNIRAECDLAWITMRPATTGDKKS